jgi:hypothetical protein
MSIPREYAKSQLMRLAGKPGWPREIEAIRELVSSLEIHATDEKHAKSCVDSFSFYSDRCPTAADIASELFTTGPGLLNRHAGCLACNGMGYVHVEIKGYSCAAPCKARPEPDEEVG